MAMQFITHDMGVVAEIADTVAVMYLGIIVERGPVDAIFNDPKHPYTQALLRSIPQLGPKVGQRLEVIKGMVPDPYNRPEGCPFHTRCIKRIPGVCNKVLPQRVELGGEHGVRCVLYGGEGGVQ
jgi:oligopeptide/dipeptide ABC transporter ATP-binding protein